MFCLKSFRVLIVESAKDKAYRVMQQLHYGKVCVTSREGTLYYHR